MPDQTEQEPQSDAITDEQAAADMNRQMVEKREDRITLAIKALRDSSLSDLSARVAALSLLDPAQVTAADVKHTRELAERFGWHGMNI